MFFRRKPILTLAVLLAVSLPLTIGFAAVSKHKGAKGAAAQMDERQRASHVLNRFTFGPQPGDLEKVTAMGVDKWFEQQLNPGKIDDSLLESRLQPLRTLKMDAREMVEEFPPNQVIKAIADGKMAMPTDSSKRAIYEARLEAYRDKRDNKAAGNDKAAGTDAPPKDQETASDSPAMREDIRRQRAEARTEAARLAALSPNDKFNAILKMDPESRRVMLRGIRDEDPQQLLNGLSPEQRETLLALVNPTQVVTNELVSSKILRSAYSERQLEEVMTDFWFNHFNVFIGKGPDRYMITSYERDVIRKHALGRFSDLLLATAKSPAMLFYLDNFQSVGPNSQVGSGQRPQIRNPRRMDGMNGGPGIFRRNRRVGRARRPYPNDPNMAGAANAGQKQRPKRGLNENYAREVMELHTLGVDGGYTQRDVTELAKVFTGWTLREPRRGGDYEFNERMHEPGQKNVLGQKIKEDGENEGKKMLEFLARNPATAHFISKKLALRFVSDDPPQSLVDRMAETFLHSKGDIKEVLRTMFRSPEFWIPETYRAKVKTPFEFVVSAVRATGADVTEPAQLGRSLQKMGMPLYGMQPPTGYSSKAEAWVNSSALLNRMNFALSLAGGKMRGVSVNPAKVLQGAQPPQDAAAGIDLLARSLLGGEISKQTRDTVLQQLQDQDRSTTATPQLGTVAGLLLGSPEFQRR